MLLGGIYYLKPAIEAAHKLGLYVITADYLPNNVAHQWSDEFVNVSIIDKEAVLKVAREKEIDGILSYAVDPGVVTAAYVAEQMGLTFPCSYEMTTMMQNKSSFRQFLQRHNFNCPKAEGFTSVDAAINEVDEFNWPVIVKPVDSAGSKGVKRVDNKEDLAAAIEGALSESHCGEFIVEEFLEKEGYSCGSEVFVVDGKIACNSIYDQYFDNEAVNPYTPSAECWPSLLPQAYKDDMEQQLQRFFDLIHVGTGLFNVEFRLCTNGKVYLMEVSPRAGGNRLAEVIKMGTGVDVITASVKSAMGMKVEIARECWSNAWAGIVLHSVRDGVFAGVTIDDSMRSNVKELALYKNEGDRVSAFGGANAAVGSVFAQFENRYALDSCLTHQDEWLKIDVR